MTLFIVAEFILNAAFAVLLVVSTPKLSVTLSALTLAVAVPTSNKVLVLLLSLLIVLLFVLCIGIPTTQQVVPEKRESWFVSLFIIEVVIRRYALGCYRYLSIREQ